MYLGQPNTPNTPATFSVRVMEHETWGRHGFNALDLVGLTFRGPLCMKLQGLEGNTMMESLGLERHLGPLNKGLFQSQNVVVVAVGSPKKK